MTSGTVSLLFLLSCNLYIPALAQAQQNAQFNQVLNLNGDMQLNSFTFPDNTKVETFSQSQRQLIVNQNTIPIDVNQVTGSTGQPFVALSQNSISLSTNGANDLVGGQIELPIDPQILQQQAVNPDNTFVGQLSPDRQSWMIMEPMRSVNITDNTVRIVKRNNMDGEYMALGRQTVETNNVLVPFGGNQAQSVVIQGTGLQENEFVDGFRMSVRATQPITMNVDVKNGIEQGMLTQLQGQQPVNDFRYLVTTNLASVQPNLNRQVTVVQLPINAVRVQQMMQQMGVGENGAVAVAVAQRAVLQNPGGATGQLQGVGGQPAAQPGAAVAPALAPALAPARRGRFQLRRDTAEARQAQAPPPTQPQAQNPAATQLLLAPTFTPIQANAVLDSLNGRIAVPVGQIDGEFIITMQQTNAGAQPQQPQAQPQQGQGGQQQQGQQQGAGQQQQQGQEQRPGAQQPEGQNATAPAAAEPPRASESARLGGAGAEQPKPQEGAGATNGTEGERKPERRQEKTDSPPAGSIIMTMKEVNQMAMAQQWGGYIPVSQMMNDYVKDNTKRR